MDLFDHARQEQIASEAPLAARMRPRTLDEFAGQEHIVGPGRLLRRAIQADQLSSLIFYGPPGSGKTTLAHIIANTTHAHFSAINAVLAGVQDIRQAIADAQDRRRLYGQRTILFVDEVHRFNKAQQDALLPHVENGTVILIGATTENPYFEVIKALVSRSRIFELRCLNQDDLRRVARRALADAERGYGRRRVQLDEDALDHLVDVANGDARAVLNALELAVETTPPAEDGTVHVTLAVAEESIQRRAVLYDKDGDVHFDTISAFIKSLRGSDPDAALYWMARMVYAGEDPRFILRRMLIFAGEDVGLADPRAIQVVTACAQAFDYVGMPEGRFHLALACLYLATAPKSNTTLSVFDAIAAVEREQEGEVPVHLKDASRDARDMGHGQGYLYPHAYRDHWVAQQYLPDNMQGRVFYQPGDRGYEAQIRTEVARRREAQLAAMLEREQSPLPLLTAAPGAPAADRWLQRTLGNLGDQLAAVRHRIMAAAGIERHSLVLDLNAESGWLTWESLRQAPVGGVWALAAEERAAGALRQQASRLDGLARPVILCGSVAQLPALIAAEGQGKVGFDVILGRNACGSLPDKREISRLIGALLLPGGRLVLAESVPHRAQRLWQLVDLSELDEAFRQQLATAEEAIYANPDDPMVNWDAADLAVVFQGAGLQQVQVSVEPYVLRQRIGAGQLARWFAAGEIAPGRPSYAQHLLKQLSAAEVDQVCALFERQLRDQWVEWTTHTAFLTARAAG
jgi:putative ATPase